MSAFSNKLKWNEIIRKGGAATNAVEVKCGVEGRNGLYKITKANQQERATHTEALGGTSVNRLTSVTKTTQATQRRGLLCS